MVEGVFRSSSTGNMHQRRSKAQELQPSLLHEDDEPKKSRQSRVSLLLVLGWITALVVFTFWRHTWLPEPKGKDIPLSEFSEARARVFLEELQSIDGFRTVGSTSNEVETPKWLLGHLNTIKDRCVAPCQFEIEVQRPTGAFGLNFLTQFQNVYANVTNILVRVQRTTHTAETPALLVSSHYDAAVGAAAASDDGVNIAIMLELVQNTIAADLPLHNGLIFNFNGAEETMLQAAHGFITQHPWKDQVAAFINLEGVGAGGRELLFQTGSDILAMAYAQGAPYPHASTIAQEVFESGVIPGITDFEAYSEHGDVAGMDFAYVANGYVYHTQLDDISRIQEGAIQRFGDNLAGTMAVLFEQPDTLASIAAKSESQRHLFFDVFGYVTVTTTESISGWINYMVVVLAAVYCVIWSRLTIRQRLSGVGRLLLMNTAALAAPLVMAAFLTFYAPMSWYASPATHLWVFVFPCTLAFLSFFPDDAPHMAQPFIEGLTLLWTALSAVLMYFGLQSVFMCVIWIFFPLVSVVVINVLKSAGLASPSMQTTALLFGPTIPFLYFVQNYILILQVFIPIMGRSGNLVPVDFIVAVLTALVTMITLSNFAPVLCHLNPSTLHTLKKYLVLATIASVVVAGISNSYSEECPKRVGINHIYRNFSHVDLPDDWGLMLNAYDFRGLGPLKPSFEQTHWANHLLPPSGPPAPFEIFDNFPWFYPISDIIPARFSWWLPANPPPVEAIPTYIDIVSSHYDPDTNLRKIHFFLTGPSHTNLYIDATNTTLTSWSLGHGRDAVPPTVDECYILQMATGSAVSAFHFWIEVESNATLNVAYCGFYLETTSPDIQKVIDTLPPWAAQSHALASWGLLRV
ncbi:Aste57867_18494 [Aphanomyces stellatus]|uniref:Aste57867_18494 protein n=1 Tax=Aphanomyces stellatus TaxID=120398 RepID=A0A485LA93_9STRA|nr:hypothetical protein As57867_018432 [Aphanomyces stellatus]VFT95230.1 Aste57867_18494 [Aphanomyces stellatus]